MWTQPEAEVFLDIARRMGVPRSSILLETAATNTGENIRFSYQVLKDNNISGNITIIPVPVGVLTLFYTLPHLVVSLGDG